MLRHFYDYSRPFKAVEESGIITRRLRFMEKAYRCHIHDLVPVLLGFSPGFKSGVAADFNLQKALILMFTLLYLDDDRFLRLFNKSPTRLESRVSGRAHQTRVYLLR